MSAAMPEGTSAAEPGKEPNSDLQAPVKENSVTVVTAGETPTVAAAQKGIALAAQNAAEAGVQCAKAIPSCRPRTAHIIS